MARNVQSFEDLIAWQKARALVQAIHHATRAKGFDWALRNQMFRAARSVMGNIAEGFDRAGPREFHKGLSVAAGSCGEVRSDLYVALDCGYISQAQFDSLSQQALEVARVVGSLRAVIARRLASEGK